MRGIPYYKSIHNRKLIDITIIIPSYNHQDYIIQRLNTILAQTYKNWEAIIIDDLSTDNSIALIENYLEKHPDFKVKHFIKNKVNSGSGYKSWQKGIELSKTNFIWITETDDYCDSTFLETTVSALKSNSNAALAFTGSNYVDAKDNFLYDTSKRFANLNLAEGQSGVFKGEVVIEDLPLNPLITNASCVVFRNPKTQIVTQFFDNKQLSDLFFWTVLLKDKSFVCINKPLNYFRRHEQSTTELNLKTNKGTIYTEYCKYLSYFNQDGLIAKKIIDHYVRHFLIPNRKLVGWFYLDPIAGLTKISKIGKLLRITRGYLKYIFKTISS